MHMYETMDIDHIPIDHHLVYQSFLMVLFVGKFVFIFRFACFSLPSLLILIFLLRACCDASLIVALHIYAGCAAHDKYVRHLINL